MNFLKSLLVFIIAYYSLKYLLFIGIFYALIVSLFKKREENEPTFTAYLWRLSTSFDQTLNACLVFILNDLMRLPKGTNYGNIDETISGVTGKNQLSNSLTWFGKIINKFLSFLDKNHIIKSIQNDEN